MGGVGQTSSWKSISFEHNRHTQLTSLLAEVSLILELIPTWLTAHIHDIKSQIQSTNVIIPKSCLIPYICMEKLLFSFHVEDVTLLPHWSLMLILGDLCLELLIFGSADLDDRERIHLTHQLAISKVASLVDRDGHLSSKVELGHGE